MSQIQCPLCLSDSTHLFYKPSVSQDPQQNKKVTAREFFRCGQCDLTFVPPSQFISKAEETVHYNFHQNNPDDVGYRQFLANMCDPMLELLPTQSSGLDYGSGPGPTLSIMFGERGHSVSNYDYIYATDSSVFDKYYDFITCTETIEHFREPRKDLFKIWGLLKTGGFLGLMTSFLTPKIDFEQWHYKNDPTHICFYSKETIKWLTELWETQIVYHSSSVVIFRKLKEFDPS